MKEIMDNGPVQGNAMPFCVCMSSLNMLVFYCQHCSHVGVTFHELKHTQLEVSDLD